MNAEGKELYAAIQSTLVGYSAKEVQVGMKRLRAATAAYFAEYEAELEENARAARQAQRYENMRVTDMET